MSIVYHEKTREFHLYNDKISYIFQIMRNGQLGQLYTGARLRDREDFSHLSELGFLPGGLKAGISGLRNRRYALSGL